MLNPDFREVIQSLNDNGVRYLVVGGYAVALHGYPRYTKDFDVWIEMSPDNADRMVAALEQFGFASLGLRAEDFLARCGVSGMLPPSGSGGCRQCAGQLH